MRRLGVAAVALVAACSGGSKGGAGQAPTYPQAKLARADTGGTPLLALVPGTADMVIELDLARVRDNPVVGPLYTAVSASARGLPMTALPVGYDVLRDADVVVVAAYAVGTADAQTLTVVRGASAPDPGDAGARLDDATVAFGPPDLVRRAESVAGGHGTSMADDNRFLRLRDVPMPEQATAAAVRVTARLGFDARVGLSRLLDLDAVPSAITLWGDVIDDLAVVAVLSGDDATDGAGYAQALGGWKSRAAADPLVRELFIGHLVRRIRVDHAGGVARAVLVIGPDTLARASARLYRALSAR